MALSEQTVVSVLTILEDGQIEMRKTRRIFDGTELLGETHHRQVLVPGQDVTNLASRVRNICAAVWTPAVIAAYQAAKAAAQSQI